MKKIEQFLIELGDRAPEKEKTGHVVVVLGATAPTVVHDTIEAAEKEAKRLIGTLPATVNQTALVLTITSAVTRMKQHVPPIEVVRLAATSPPAMKVGEPGPIMFGPASEAMSLLPAQIAAAHAADQGEAKPAPAPKFKPGDRVYFAAWETGERVYGVVCPPLSGAPSVGIVWGNWDHPNLSGKPHAMALDRVFPDLRTVAGGGVLKLRHACSGRTRSGRTVNLTTYNSDSLFPFGVAATNEWWTEHGRWNLGDTDDALDIVELIEEGA